LALYASVLRPRIQRLGTSSEERTATYPGDDLIPGGRRYGAMATTIAAPPERVWPWLVQMGCDRAGFFGCPSRLPCDPGSPLGRTWRRAMAAPVPPVLCACTLARRRAARSAERQRASPGGREQIEDLTTSRSQPSQARTAGHERRSSLLVLPAGAGAQRRLRRLGQTGFRFRGRSRSPHLPGSRPACRAGRG
jgi:hypothetical protein